MDCQDGTVRLKLEGRLVSAWVDLLNAACREVLEDHSILIVDLSSVSFASPEGFALLRRLEKEGARCIQWPHFLRELTDLQTLQEE
jgi:hypothetical protein